MKNFYSFKTQLLLNNILVFILADFIVGYLPIYGHWIFYPMSKMKTNFYMALVLIILLYFILSTISVTRALNNLINKTKLISSGVYSIHHETKDYKEFIELYSYLDIINENVKFSKSKIQSLNSQFEKRVIYRTKQLNDTNCALKELNHGLDSIIIKQATELHDMNAALKANSATLQNEFLQRVKVEKALQKSNELYRSIYENSPLAFGILDTDFKFIDWNKKAEQLFIWSKEEVIGKRFMDFLVPKEISSVIINTAKKLAHNGIPEVTSNENLTKDGMILFCEWHSSILHDENGACIGFISMVLDKTENIKAEKLIIKAKKQTDEANNSKHKFLANMSHEIRTPMNGIMGMIQLALMSNLDEEPREYLSLVMKSAKVLLTIINDILDISRIETGKIVIQSRPFKITDVIYEVTTLFDISATEKNIILNVEIDKNIPSTLNGDAIRLRQVLSNLIGNAIKFTEIGKVTINATIKHMDKNSVCVRFSIKDTGIGIPKSKQSLLFQIFKQLDSTYTKQYQGVGLGLAISKNLVQLMGGYICLESKENIGTEFYFTIRFQKIQAI